MRIGVLVGKKPNGEHEYVGKPGSVDALDKELRKLVEGGPYVKVWLTDASQNPLKARKCTLKAKPKAKGKAKPKA